MREDVIKRAIRELRERRVVIEQAIQLVEAVASGQPKRGRPPKILAGLVSREKGIKKLAEKAGNSDIVVSGVVLRLDCNLSRVAAVPAVKLRYQMAGYTQTPVPRVL